MTELIDLFLCLHFLAHHRQKVKDLGEKFYTMFIKSMYKTEFSQFRKNICCPLKNANRDRYLREEIIAELRLRLRGRKNCNFRIKDCKSENQSLNCNLYFAIISSLSNISKFQVTNISRTLDMPIQILQASTDIFRTFFVILDVHMYGPVQVADKNLSFDCEQASIFTATFTF